jgi:osmotically inducible protein OsmC
MKRSAHAVWNGRLKAGQGAISTESRVLQDSPYSFSTRFGDQAGTNPEELLAAAVASCFSMALSNELELAGLAATLIETHALVRIDFAEEKWSIREVDLFLKANIHGAPSLPFLVAASRAKAHCPLSRALAAQVKLHTELRDQHPGSEAEEEVVVYTSTYCQVCGRAKALLCSAGGKLESMS